MDHKNTPKENVGSYVNYFGEQNNSLVELYTNSFSLSLKNSYSSIYFAYACEYYQICAPFHLENPMEGFN